MLLEVAESSSKAKGKTKKEPTFNDFILHITQMQTGTEVSLKYSVFALSFCLQH